MTQRRYDPLADRWVVVSQGRLGRPWRGAQDAPATAVLPAHDASCFLCPGNARTNGVVNPDYRGPYVFDNDYPALSATVEPDLPHPHSLLRTLPTRGRCRVLCYGPDHHRGLGDLTDQERCAVIDTWQQQWRELDAEFAWVQLFENRGEAMGASSPHPHGQIWATSHLPSIPATEDLRQAAYYDEHGRPLLADYLAVELDRRERLVHVNDHWVALVPYWATWPFEVMVIARNDIPSFATLDRASRDDLATLLGVLLARYDALFGVPFPYSMGWHGRTSPHWRLHAHFYPPLLRSATVRKHMVGFEMLAEAQRDLSPEEAAERLSKALD